MRRSVGVFGVVVLAALVWAYSGSLSFAADKIGVVLMHGKGGHPGAAIDGLAAKLSAAGFDVATPEMPWSRTRIYDKDYEESMAEIDVAVAKLKAKGATRIVVAGQSMGANAAIGYGARRDGLAAVVAIAAGHSPGSPGFRKKLGADVEKARALVAAGKGEDVISAGDINQGEYFPRKVRASVYLSWFDPTGPASMPRNAAKLKLATPFMWIVGEDDRISTFGRQVIYDKAPPNPKNVYVVVPGGHMDTPRIGADKIVAWLKGL